MAVKKIGFSQRLNRKKAIGQDGNLGRRLLLLIAGGVMAMGLLFEATNLLSVRLLFQGSDAPQVTEPSTFINNSCQEGVIYRVAGLPPIKDRRHIAKLLQARGFTDGIEIGVKYGKHASIILSQWTSCKNFHLVDLWRNQENYVDGSNADDKEMENRYQGTMNALSTWKNKTTFHRMLSTEAAKEIEDLSMDFVYVDARHDYCGCKEDMEAYWSKLRPGGIMAGHDFLYGREAPKGENNDWSVCQDGSKKEGSVRGAAQEFAQKHGLTVSVMYGETRFWTWMMQKPTISKCVQETGEWTTMDIP